VGLGNLLDQGEADAHTSADLGFVSLRSVALSDERITDLLPSTDTETTEMFGEHRLRNGSKIVECDHAVVVRSLRLFRLEAMVST
jgi:hypothetical protein